MQGFAHTHQHNIGNMSMLLLPGRAAALQGPVLVHEQSRALGRLSHLCSNVAQTPSDLLHKMCSPAHSCLAGDTDVARALLSLCRWIEHKYDSINFPITSSSKILRVRSSFDAARCDNAGPIVCLCVKLFAQALWKIAHGSEIRDQVLIKPTVELFSTKRWLFMVIITAHLRQSQGEKIVFSVIESICVCP